MMPLIMWEVPEPMRVPSSRSMLLNASVVAMNGCLMPTIHDSTLLNATVACNKVESCMIQKNVESNFVESNFVESNFVACNNVEPCMLKVACNFVEPNYVESCMLEVASNKVACNMLPESRAVLYFRATFYRTNL